MKFYDRKRELDALEKIYSRPGADLVIITGRRRIGKTRLIDEFVKNKKAIGVFVVPKEEKQVAKDMEDEIRAKLGYSPPFGTFREALEYLFEQNVELVYFDEFPNVLLVNPAIPYELQRHWDRYKNTKDVLMLVSGSYAGMMNRLFTSRKAPLFNRATSTLNLRPLSFGSVVKILNDMGVSNPVEQVSYFCIFGGVPYYYLLLEKQDNKRFETAVDAFFFDAGAQLREEGENVLKQEFGNAYAKYYAVLEAIHAGRVSMGEISQKVGVRSTTLTKYMKALQHDFKMVERTVPFGQNPSRSKKGQYFVLDNMLAFWFANVYGKRAVPTNDELNAFLGKRFELLCMEFLEGLLEKKGERVAKAGKWWGPVEAESGKFEQGEIDVVVETENALYIGECKWTNQKPGKTELQRLKYSSRTITAKAKKPVKWVLFSKEGFDIRESDDVLLFDVKKMTEVSMADK